MAKTSKRKYGQKEVIQQPVKIYQVGIYVRISSSRKEDSLQSQLEIIKGHIARCDEKMVVCGVYTDNGKTGTNFERGGFLKLLQDIRLGRINCVVVKDLSRFGRNYLETGDYIEKIFPMLGVRFISVTEGVDTAKKSVDTLDIKVRNLVNTSYATDISEKMTMTQRLLQEEGAYVGGAGPYGYKRGTGKEKGKLLPDPDVKDILKMIFVLYSEEKKMTAVIHYLAEKRVNTPGVYVKTGKVYAEEGEEYVQWTIGTLVGIMKNRIYIGCLEQRKSTMRGGKNRILNDREDWILHENYCEPLVSEELFQRVQELRAASKHVNKKSSNSPKLTENVLYGKIFCGVCGKPMVRYSNIVHLKSGKCTRKEAYECQRQYRIDSKKCVSNRIFREEVEKKILDRIRQETGKGVTTGKKTQGNWIQDKQNYENEKKKMLYTLGDLQERQKKLYASYITQAVSKEVFQKENEILHRQQAKAEKQLAITEDELKRLMAGRERLEKASRKKWGKELTLEMVQDWIDRVEIYPGKEVEIYLQDPFGTPAGIAEQGKEEAGSLYVESDGKGAYVCS